MNDEHAAASWPHLSTSASTTASNTAPPTPPSHRALATAKDEFDEESGLPALHLLNMACDDAVSDGSDEADGFFALDMDVSIDQQLQTSDGFEAPTSTYAHPALRRASECTYSSSPLQNVGLDPVIARRSRTSPTQAVAAAVAETASPASFGPIAPEVDAKGNLEYKLKILPPSRERFDRLVTQLKWRLLEGGGVAVYEIGVLDDGTLIGLDPDSMKDSLKLLALMAGEVGAECSVHRVLALERIAAASELSLRALAPEEAVECLQPYIASAAELQPEIREQILQQAKAGMYRFDMAEQQHIPTALHQSPSSKMVPRSSSSNKRTLDVDASAVVYLPSKEEKRLMRAEAQAETQERSMNKMTRVADSVQPKTARARARTQRHTVSGYESVLAAAGVLSERAARKLYGSPQEREHHQHAARLIVEAVVRVAT